MTRKTVLFGNGLGMALSPEAFSLDNALSRVWEDGEALTIDQRSLIRGCLPTDTELERPSSEDDLDELQRVLASCDFLMGIEIDGGAHWLSAEGREFPSAIRKFIHRVACQFHGTGLVLPTQFSRPLQDFVRRTKSHVATLNYDPLLYNEFISSRILSGYSGSLIDGLTSAGFRESNLFRRSEDSLGWYLHLHGSPLFYDGSNGRVKKMPRSRACESDVEGSHIVLTHVRHKQSIISASNILSSYWVYFERAIDESSEIIVFGYSGFDYHLNSLLASRAKNKRVRIIEWAGSEPGDDRLYYWSERLGYTPEVVSLDNILQFSDW